MNEINPQYSPWVKKLLALKLFSPGSGSAWPDHVLEIHAKYKNRGILLGSLSREEVEEMRTKWMETAFPYLENPSVHDRDKKALQRDLEAVKWAGICLDRLAEHEAGESWRSDIEQEPLEGDPASGEDDEAKRGDTLEPAGNVRDLELQFGEVRDQAPPSAEFEVREQSQPEPALPPAAPLSRFQDSGADERSTQGLVDPEFIHTREQFVEACHVVAQRINETENLWEAKRLSGMGEILQALASTMQLGKEFELWGKALRLRAYYRAAQIQQNQHVNGEKIFDERLIRDLKNLPEDEFEQMLTQAVEKGNLADRIFRVSGSKSTRAMPRNRADQLDPMRFFIAFLADMRTNPDSFGPNEMAKFVQHPLVQENFAAIEQIYIDFSVAFVGAWRAWKAQTPEQAVK